MKSEDIFNVFLKQDFTDWHKDTFEKYVANGEYSKEQMLEDIKYFFNLEK